MRINVGNIAVQIQQRVPSSRRPCACGISPTETATGRGRLLSSRERTESGPSPHRSGRGHITAVPCQSRPARSPRRSASRATRSHRPVSSALPCRRIPYGRVCRASNAGTSRCRGGFPDRSAGRMPSKETDPSRRNFSDRNRRGSAIHICETLCSAGARSVGRKPYGPRFIPHCAASGCSAQAAICGLGISNRSRAKQAIRH